MISRVYLLILFERKWNEYDMSLWMVRAGSYGEQEQYALEKNIVTIGWNELQDLSKFK